ncbi:MAG TPA: LemA family protein [Bacteroidales bacterium]|nr:LemA family protein [Bacteroidales bacterium]
MAIYIIIGIVLLIILITVIFFNKFISYRNRIRNAWSDIDVQLKRRYSLIPNLVESVKGYAVHEKDLFENVAKYRAQAENARTLKEHEAAENNMISVLKNILVTVENYPALLANENFMKLQDSLIEVEDTIQNARRYYNAVVRDNNTAVESFPGNVFAGLLGFKTADFFEIDSIEREVIKVEIKK